MADKSAFVPFDINNAHRDNDGNDVNMDIELFGSKNPDTQAPAVVEESLNATQPVASPSASPNSTTTATSKSSPKKFEYKKSTTYKKTVAK